MPVSSCGRSLYIVDWRMVVVGENVLHHVKRERGNCPNGGNVGGICPRGNVLHSFWDGAEGHKSTNVSQSPILPRRSLPLQSFIAHIVIKPPGLIGIMLLNFPGGSTLQLGAGRGLVCHLLRQFND